MSFAFLNSIFFFKIRIIIIRIKWRSNQYELFFNEIVKKNNRNNHKLNHWNIKLINIRIC